MCVLIEELDNPNPTSLRIPLSTSDLSNQSSSSSPQSNANSLSDTNASSIRRPPTVISYCESLLPKIYIDAAYTNDCEEICTRERRDSGVGSSLTRDKKYQDCICKIIEKQNFLF